ncbi:hypothetical protein ARMSODRAFT_980418 [Armillaria solidipes]|uniref:Uncharacterized protein n=1 Tax=Armillaria solidipes TaxID=1076256 RepID=A0A2H3BI89_9AGAR|nr:hypothetical protein ARMSODRAFT_980418 [Armillaria solidipes]
MVIFGPQPPVAFLGDSTPTTEFLSFVTDSSPLPLDFCFDDIDVCHLYRDLGTLDNAIIGVLPIPGLYQYAVRLEYSDQQRTWLEEQGLCMELAVIADCAELFFAGLYTQWFGKWPSENRADEEQHRIIHFFPSYKWIENRDLPDGWMQQMAFEKLDYLEGVITQQYEVIAYIFD